MCIRDRLLSVDRGGLPQNANPKHCFTWVCGLQHLHRMLASSEPFDLESISSVHLVCGQSPDMRRLRLMPPVHLEENTYVLVIFLERMHDVIFAYDCLRSSQLRLKESGDSDFLALRAWCGASSKEKAPLRALFGTPGERDYLIEQTETCLLYTSDAADE